jgi:hypothetical protein
MLFLIGWLRLSGKKMQGMFKIFSAHRAAIRARSGQQALLLVPFGVFTNFPFEHGSYGPQSRHAKLF